MRSDSIRNLISAAFILLGLSGLSVLRSDMGSDWIGSLAAEEPLWRSQVHEIDGPRQNLLQQVTQLIQSKQYSDAYELLQRLEDESEGRVILFAQTPSTAPFRVGRYVSISQFCQALRLSWGSSAPEALAGFRKLIDAQAARELEEFRLSHDVKLGSVLADRYLASSVGDQWQLELGDLYAEIGWFSAARACYQRLDPLCRVDVDASVESSDAPGSLSIHVGRLLPTSASDDQIKNLADYFADENRSATPVGLPGHLSIPDSKIPKGEVWGRLIWCSLMEGDLARAKLEQRFLNRMYPDAVLVSNPKKLWKDQVEQWVAESSQWKQRSPKSDWPMLGGCAARNAKGATEPHPTDWPRWSQVVPRLTAGNDRTPGGSPRLGELADGLLSYHPAVHDGRVFVNDLQRIMAYDLKTGDAWPSAKPAYPLFDSGLTQQNLLPVGYASCGVPRGMVAICQDQLYARLGTVVTGWIQTPVEAKGSLGYIIGIDLKREGKMLEGFPLHLQGAEWEACEPEGCPLPIDDDLYLMVTQRNSVQLKRFVACFDRWNGELRWKSPPIAAGSIEGAVEANLVSHQMLSASGGKLFCNSGLGVIASIDRFSGAIDWLVRYPRSSPEDSPYPTPQRFRFRDVAPCLVHSDLVIAAPADCPEIFCLDASTGDLIWSTVQEHSADLLHLLGAEGNTLIASGDRLVWFDLHDGKMMASYPEGVASRPNEGLPSPRGLGRGVVTANRVYFPTIDRVVVADRQLTKSDRGWKISMQDPIDLTSRGAEGGNLVLSEEWMVLATPSRVIALQQPTKEPAVNAPPAGEKLPK